MTATLEPWRTAPAPPPLLICQRYFCQPPVLSADVLLPREVTGGGALAVVHSNGAAVPAAVVRNTLALQGIDVPTGAHVYNPSLNRSFGAWLTSGSPSTALVRQAGSTPHTATATATATTTGGGVELAVAMVTVTEGNWPDAARAEAAQAARMGWSDAVAAHTAVWESLWDRSYMRVATPVAPSSRTHVSTSTAFNPTAVTVLQRFLDLSDGRRAHFPISGGGQYPWSYA